MTVVRSGRREHKTPHALTHPHLPYSPSPQHDQTVSSVGARIKGDLNLGQLEDWISDLLKAKGTELFRYKGVLSIKGFDTKWIFQVPHRKAQPDV